MKKLGHIGNGSAEDESKNNVNYLNWYDEEIDIVRVNCQKNIKKIKIWKMCQKIRCTKALG